VYVSLMQTRSCFFAPRGTTLGHVLSTERAVRSYCETCLRVRSVAVGTPSEAGQRRAAIRVNRGYVLASPRVYACFTRLILVSGLSKPCDGENGLWLTGDE
jgi:hypothetical protein